MKSGEQKIMAMTQFHKGMKFRSLREVQVRGVVAYGAPYSTGFDGTLPVGEIVVCSQEPGPQGMWLVPERYKHFEQLFVPEQVRQNPDYGGYAVECLFSQIGQDYEMVGEKAAT
ncbi:MAG: hypothetical protein ACLQU4_18335 [Limisphaerales bacterium]